MVDLSESLRINGGNGAFLSLRMCSSTWSRRQTVPS